jgi:putative ABC transport system permease protein
VALGDVALQVVGIFETGFGFGDYQVFLPLDVAQDQFKRPGKITHIYATAASVDRVEQVEQGLRAAFGDDADIITGKDAVVTWAKALNAIRANSLVAAAVAVGAATLIVLFTMVLVTRERTREIGILKAIGATNGDVARQFIAESLGLALVGGLVGLAVFAAGGVRIAAVVMTAVSATLTPHTTLGGENPLAAIFLRGNLTAGSLAAILAAVVVLTVAGSLASVTKAVRLRPVEAIRYE